MPPQRDLQSRVLDWLRWLSPFVLGGVGLYVSLVVGPLIARLEALESQIKILQVEQAKDREMLRDVQAFHRYVIEPHLKRHGND